MTVRTRQQQQHNQHHRPPRHPALPLPAYSVSNHFSRVMFRILTYLQSASIIICINIGPYLACKQRVHGTIRSKFENRETWPLAYFHLPTSIVSNCTVNLCLPISSVQVHPIRSVKSSREGEVVFDTVSPGSVLITARWRCIYNITKVRKAASDSGIGSIAAAISRRNSYVACRPLARRSRRRCLQQQQQQQQRSVTSFRSPLPGRRRRRYGMAHTLHWR